MDCPRLCRREPEPTPDESPATLQARRDFKDAGGTLKLVADLLALSAEVATYDPADLAAPGCDEPTIDCRLRYHDGCFSFLTGDSFYDQDPRGHWGCSSVGLNLAEDDARGIAVNLLDQVLDGIAESQD